MRNSIASSRPSSRDSRRKHSPRTQRNFAESSRGCDRCGGPTRGAAARVPGFGKTPPAGIRSAKRKTAPATVRVSRQRGLRNVQGSLRPGDNSQHSDWARGTRHRDVPGDRGRITRTSRLRGAPPRRALPPLETGLPAHSRTPEEIKRQRRSTTKFRCEKVLQLIADSFLDQVGNRAEAAGVAAHTPTPEGINYYEIVRELNRGEGRLPGLIGFRSPTARRVRREREDPHDVQLGADGASWPRTKAKPRGSLATRDASTT